MAPRFGIFDWLDDAGRSLGDIYEDRLHLLELADRGPFWGYHLAEHHGTPLGLAPSPNLFLSAAAQRTRRIRLGTLVNVLPLYEPVRLWEEVCMLDHLSGGRLDLGIGRGGNPYELANYGVAVEEARDRYLEVWDILRRGLLDGHVDHEGDRYRRRAGTPLRPLQRPYPPLWYPTSSPQSIPFAAEQGLNAVFAFLLARQGMAPGAATASYREALDKHRRDPGRLNGHVAEPLYGHARHVYVAETDAQARAEAMPALARWFESFNHLWLRERGEEYWPVDLERFAEEGYLLAGSPATVRRRLQECLPAWGGNYFLGAFAFGNLTREQMLRSLDLFGREVIPGL
ncbi:MAG: LLM class flavin-dependent oxidoreductase [Candidatus Dormibacteraeota bacterium]|nr:LLM class flavin-dependent oxidoreductase [Candidatus Dormibacteraeota bacterium]